MIDHSDIRRIWRQAQDPVIYRPGARDPLIVKLPDGENNAEWLRGTHRTRPEWVAGRKHWTVPRSWFDDLIWSAIDRYDRVYVIQPYSAHEKCAPACWRAEGFECHCSCMGEHHGRDAAVAGWRVISETFAVRWRDGDVACRIIRRGDG